MFILHVNIYVKPECVDAFIAATRTNAAGSLREPGVVRFDLIRDLDDPTHFTLVEVYRTSEDAWKHKETAHYAQWQSVAPDMMREPRTRQRFENIYPGDESWKK